MQKRITSSVNNDKEPSFEKGKYLLLLFFLTFIVIVFFTSKYAAPSFVITFIFIQLFLLIAPKLGFIDTPNFRSSHTIETPKCGVALFVTFIVAASFTNFQIYQDYSLSALAVLMVFLLGVYDDLKGSRARHKIFIITIASLFVIADGFIINSIGTYFNQNIILFWLSIPVTIFAIVGFTNSMNLIDGLDGLAASVSIIILSSLFIIGYQNNDLMILGITSLIIPILIAFLFFNWNPASTFMGDCGSLTLGFIIAILSIKAIEYVNPIAILYIVAIPIIDTTVIMVRRWKNNFPIFSPDKKHMHHILLVRFEGSVSKTVLIITFMQFAYSSIGVLFISFLSQEIAVVFLISNIIFWYLFLAHQHEKKDQNLLDNKTS